MTFLIEVMDKLRAENVDAVLSPDEVDLCQRAVDYGVGPNDTAYQIIDNRADTGRV